MAVQYLPKDFKSILNKLKFIDSWFWCRYTLNPYNGCEFACTYCDSRSHKYHLHPEFDHIIYVKANVGPMLDSRLGRARTLLPDVVAVGGTVEHEFDRGHAFRRRCPGSIRSSRCPRRAI